jgi:hypothetical protein
MLLIQERDSTSNNALRDITTGVGLQIPILIVPRKGFWIYINRHLVTQHFIAVTPDGVIYEEQHEPGCTDVELAYLQFGALISHIAEKYSVAIPDTLTLFEYWTHEYRSLSNAIYRYDHKNRGWKNERVA